MPKGLHSTHNPLTRADLVSHGERPIGPFLICLVSETALMYRELISFLDDESEESFTARTAGVDYVPWDSICPSSLNVFFFLLLFCVGTASGKCPLSWVLGSFLTLENLGLRLRLPIITFLSGTGECTRTLHGKERGAVFYAAFVVIRDD